MSDCPFIQGKARRLLSKEEAALYLGRTPAGVLGLKNKGVLPFVKIDGRLQFDIYDLDDMIRRSKQSLTY